MRQCYGGILPITRADSGAPATGAATFGLVLRSAAARSRLGVKVADSRDAPSGPSTKRLP
jgi:hypothetical protein